ncbi:hypothetical protein GMD88_17435 [Pseudoflavonifractor sp. BIOML-A6]|nr:MULTISPECIES: hypothetical protein [unclassified Pseudoflavonifractor]MTQ98579.1 hypothetical protein [Pseudoflavonifractor sp. BIOML-A16]MTR07854.1 hypothetical protein [Pseudoflavonifractor sp. BIOML-A15]MTR34045.1 hypothetical protein [Pseudoflavonifractor sp. BIOML-A14]MTR74803.1 hypothetical protein [Pseudoflavonifractor sp. BIOML-A18]MTS66030.1 hypothetical protein [Pseudoflavonifractor sp. BIOML-A5]MTS73348.1 hypothetical protein [Pseudoflavonifractor sp. BIOML-A8]MTS92607.1 hypoth
MKPVFKVDGVSYNVIVPEGGLKRQGRVLDGESVGRMLSGRMMRDIVGTYYNYAMQLDTRNLDVAQYDALYQVLSAPVDYHTVILPYGQSTLTFQAYVTNLDDELVLMQEGRNLWGNLSFTFVAMQPERT